MVTYKRSGGAVEESGARLKVWFDVHNPRLGQVMHRITREYKRHAPTAHVEFVSTPNDADVVVSHIIGHPCVTRTVGYNKPFALMQHCFVTASGSGKRQGAAADFEGLWHMALFTSSYLDLAAAGCPRALRLPWGADPDVFRIPTPIPPRDILAFTHGYSNADEPIEPMLLAATVDAGGRAAHLGGLCYTPEPRIDRYVDQQDSELAHLYARSKYVSALRYGEGFEVPGVEGLLCGARPVCFDLPVYRHWYGSLADYIPARTRHEPDAVRADLAALFRGPYRAVTAIERRHAIERYSWNTTAREFWRVLLERASEEGIGQ